MITAAEVVGAVRRQATEHPERVARSCYIGQNGPSCIIGHALTDLGVGENALIPLNTDSITYLIDFLFPTLARTPQVVEWLQKVQDVQDKGWSWFTAVHEADWAVLV